MSQGRGHGERSCGVLTGLRLPLNMGRSNWHCHGAASNHHSEAEGGSFNSARKRSAWSNVITPNLPNIFSRFHLKIHLLEEAGSQIMSVLLFMYLCYMCIICCMYAFFFPFCVCLLLGPLEFREEGSYQAFFCLYLSFEQSQSSLNPWQDSIRSRLIKYS